MIIFIIDKNPHPNYIIPFNESINLGSENHRWKGNRSYASNSNCQIFFTSSFFFHLIIKIHDVRPYANSGADVTKFEWIHFVWCFFLCLATAIFYELAKFFFRSQKVKDANTLFCVCECEKFRQITLEIRSSSSSFFIDLRKTIYHKTLTTQMQFW